jgi:hypothetical protein
MTAPNVRQHEYEPVPGLPERLPQGEAIIWQGRPDARRIAVDVLKERWIAGYFVVLIGWAVAAGLADGRAPASIVFAAAVLCILAAVVIGLVELFAYAAKRTTLYTITNRRLVMRVGVGTSVTLNLPFARVASAAMVARKDGSGDIVFEPADGVRLSWFHLWPHVRPWRFGSPQPALRCIPQVKQVAQLIVAELKVAHGAAETSGAASEAIAIATPSIRRKREHRISAGTVQAPAE